MNRESAAVFFNVSDQCLDGKYNLDSYISLTNLSFKSILGVLPEERLSPQDISLDLDLFLNTRKCAYTEELRHSVDYAQIFLELNFILLAGRFELLETAAECLASYLLAPTLAVLERAQIQKVQLRLKKNNAFNNQGVSGINLIREYNDFSYRAENSIFGSTDIIFENDHFGLYRLHVSPGSCMPRHYHSKIDEAEMPLTSGLLLQTQPVKKNQIFFWPRGFVHQYDNLSNQEQIILCLDRPAFFADDEIETAKPLSKLENLDPAIQQV